MTAIITLCVLGFILLLGLAFLLSYLAEKNFKQSIARYRQKFLDMALEEMKLQKYEFKNKVNYLELINRLNSEITDNRSHMKIKDSVLNDGPRKKVQLKNIIVNSIRNDFSSKISENSGIIIYKTGYFEIQDKPTFTGIFEKESYSVKEESAEIEKTTTWEGW